MPKKSFNFNQKFMELEKITQELESGDLDLDKSIKKFEQGLKIAEELKKHLKQVENKIIELKKSK